MNTKDFRNFGFYWTALLLPEVITFLVKVSQAIFKTFRGKCILMIMIIIELISQLCLHISEIMFACTYCNMCMVNQLKSKK